MRSQLVAVFAALALVAVAVPNAARAAQTGNWSIGPARHTEDAGARVQLRLEYTENDSSGTSHSSWSSPVTYGELGLSAERVRAPIGPVSFRIDREPGTFACSGSAGDGSGAGQFVFTPSDAFAGAVASRGLGRPTERQALELAIAGTTLAFVDQLRATMSHASIGDVVRIVQHGVTPRYVAELAALGYRAPGDALVRLRDHGVTADFIRAVQSAGFRNLSADDLVRLVDHGVGPKYITGMRAAGYTSVTADQLVTLRDHGVSTEYIADLRAHGYTNLSTDDLVRLRDHGVRAGYVDDLARNGYKNLTADDLVTLADHGVSVAFIERLKSHGYTNVSVRDLIRLRDSGI